MELTRVMERDQQVQLEPSAKRRCNGTNVFSSVFSNGFHGGTNDHGGFRHAPVNGGHGWPGAMPNNSRRRMCGLYMPSYGGFSNLRGEICTVTIDKRHCSFLGVDIRVLECSQPEAERQAIIHNVQVVIIVYNFSMKIGDTLLCHAHRIFWWGMWNM